MAVRFFSGFSFTQWCYFCGFSLHKSFFFCNEFSFIGLRCIMMTPFSQVCFFLLLLYSKEHINYRIILLQQHSTKRENSYTVLRSSIGEIGLGSLAHKWQFGKSEQSELRTVFQNHRKGFVQHEKCQKRVNFGKFLKTWSLRSNSVTRQVTFDWT